MDTLLISEKFIKQNSSLDDNVSAKLIFPIVLKVQRKYIEPLLGTDLYNDICTQVDNSGTTIDAKYKTLVDEYIVYIILYYFQAEYIVEGNFKFRQKGVGTHTDEFMQQPNDVFWLKKHYENDAELIAQRLINYLCHNHNTYPLYTTNTREDVQPRFNGYDTTWVL